jgi:transcriptional regulator with XRE-family HTH domain
MSEAPQPLGRLDPERLRAAMHRAGLRSLAGLCARAGIHRNSLAPYLRGRRSPYAPVFEALCRALHVPPERLLRPQAAGLEARVAALAERVVAEFRPRLPALAAVLFGSRAQGAARAGEWSDFDLGLTCGAVKLTARDYLALREAFLAAGDDLPVRLDILNLDGAPDRFLRNLAAQNILFLAGDPLTFRFLEGRLHAIREIQAAS